MENKDSLFFTFKKESQLGKYDIHESLQDADSETSYIAFRAMMPSLSNYLEVSLIEGKPPHTCTRSPYLPNKHGCKYSIYRVSAMSKYGVLLS